MNHAWKSISGLVGFTSSFDQLKIQFYTETKKKTEKVIFENCQSLQRRSIYLDLPAFTEVVQWLLLSCCFLFNKRNSYLSL